MQRLLGLAAATALILSATLAHADEAHRLHHEHQ